MSEHRKSSTITTFKKVSEIEFYRSSFIAGNNKLNRVDVLFKNPNLESRDELDLVVKSDGEVVYKQGFTGFNFGDTSYARLDFPVILNSRDKIIEIEVIPKLIVDGKLQFGLKDGELDLVSYYESNLDVKRALVNSIEMMKDRTILLPLIFVTLFLW